jgi:integrase
MFTEPEIVSDNDLSKRCYIKVYINGKRYRFYNGSLLGIQCNPNRQLSVKDRNKSIAKLLYEVRKKLESGWVPDGSNKNNPIQQQNISINSSLLLVKKLFENRDLSDLYKRDIRLITEDLTAFLRSKGLLNQPIGKLNSSVLSSFLSKYEHSGTYYMNKRRTLSGLFSKMVQEGIIEVNPVKFTSRIKEKATLNQAFTKDQLHAVLQKLKSSHSNLYLCAMLMYGCLLRPHQEIRCLTRKHFNPDLTKITLSGGENKSKRIRTVYIPDYVRSELKKMGVETLGLEDNIFTRTNIPFNESYFNTQWTRIKAVLLKSRVIRREHTLYSFRHTAAINLYSKTRDIFKVQQAMGHSSMTVTLTYMRSLGLLNPSCKEDVPDL